MRAPLEKLSFLFSIFKRYLPTRCIYIRIRLNAYNFPSFELRVIHGSNQMVEMV